MASTRMAERISHGLESALAGGGEPPGRLEEPSLGLLPIRELVRIVRDEALPVGRREQILASLMRCYRRRPASAWSAIILAALGPSLVRIANFFRGGPRGVDEEDVQQQILLEALGVAGSIALGDSGRDLVRRAELAIEEATLSRLSMLARARGNDQPEGDVSEHLASFAEEMSLALAARSDVDTLLRLLVFFYRTEIADGVLADIALQWGTSPAAVQRRHLRVVRRILREDPELFARFAAAVHGPSGSGSRT